MSIGRFNERYHIKGHLSAGAHGIIFAATDRSEFTSYKHVTSNETLFVNSSKNRESSNNISIDLQHESPNNELELCDYAIKRIFVRNRIMPLSVLREIKTLEFLRGSPNVCSSKFFVLVLNI